MPQTAYQTDVDGVFVGVVDCQPDPENAGDYLTPGGAYRDAPPMLTDGQRAVRMHDTNTWRVETVPTDGNAPALTAEALAAQQQAAYMASAVAAYAESTDIVMRCYENSMPVPTDWVAYRKALRTIIDSVSRVDGSQPLPVRPSDPDAI